MPPDHLTFAADQIATHVQAVVAGEPPAKTAAQLGLDPADLADAVESYQAAGLAALQRRSERSWFQARIQIPDWAAAEATFAARIAPRLDEVDAGKASWWFLRKYPCWRVRVRTPTPSTVEALLDELVAVALIDRWWPGIYEAESHAFGGAAAMEIVHDLFCADSRGVIAYARQRAPALGRRELSLLLIRALQHRASLDWFEVGDVFDRIAQMRPAPAGPDATRIDGLASQVRRLLVTPVDEGAPLFGSGGPAAFASQWLAGFVQAGQRLGEAANAGRLDRGLRAVLAHIVIFHWNRLGLSARTQGVLAYAAKAAVLSRS